MHGTYVRGWRHDWQAAREEHDRLLAAGREIAAAHVADPGIVSCRTCGQHHWREYEVFVCCRCGAETTIGYERGERGIGREVVTSGPPADPSKVPPRLTEGLRVRWNPKDLDGIGPGTRRWKLKNFGGWSAGPIPPGTCGTVRKDTDSPFGREDIGWHVEFDGLTPKDGYKWGVLGPFLDDEFELETPR